MDTRAEMKHAARNLLVCVPCSRAVPLIEETVKRHPSDKSHGVHVVMMSK